MAMVDKLLFNLKHWQVFLLSLSLIMLNGIFFRAEPGIKGVIGDFLPGSFFIAWMMLVGTRLRRKLPPGYNDRYLLFIVTGILLIAIGIAFGIFRQELQTFFDTHLPLLLLLIAVFFVVGFVFISYVARAMYALAKRDNDPDVARYGGDVFLWGTWFVGLWVLQPRLNRLYDQYYS